MNLPWVKTRLKELERLLEGRGFSGEHRKVRGTEHVEVRDQDSQDRDAPEHVQYREPFARPYRRQCVCGSLYRDLPFVVQTPFTLRHLPRKTHPLQTSTLSNFSTQVAFVLLVRKFALMEDARASLV